MYLLNFITFFNIVLKDHENFDVSIQQHRKNFNDDYLKSIPYAVFCGSLNALQCCHVIIGENYYHFTTCTEAIDFLFKLFISLKIDYPGMTAHLWAFFQHYVYKLEKERRTVASRLINEFVCQLENAPKVA